MIQQHDQHDHVSLSTAERFAALVRVGTALLSELDETRLLTLIAETACGLTGAGFAAFSIRPVNEEGQPLVPSEGSLFHLAAVVGVTPEQEALFRRMPLGGEGLLAPIFQQGVPVLVGDALAHLALSAQHTLDARTAAREAAVAYAQGRLSPEALPSLGVPWGHLVVRSFLGAPVLDRMGQVRGGLLLGHPEPNQFSKEDETLLVSLAGQAAVALENTRLYLMAQRRAQQLDAILDSIADGVTLVDQQVTIVRENRAARHLRTALSEMTEAEQLLDTFQQTPARHALAGEHKEHTMQVVVSGTGTHEFLITAHPLRPVTAPSGSSTHDPVRESAGHAPGAVMVWHDITEQRVRESERTAKAQAKQLEAIFDAISDALFVYDRQGYIIQTNTAAREFIARVLPSDDVVGASPHQRFTRLSMTDARGQPFSFEHWPVTRLLAGEEVAPENAIEITFQAIDGQVLHTSVTGGPLRDAGGNLMGAVAVYRDVTERKRAEREREQLEQLEREARAETEAQRALLQLILDELPSSVYLVRGKEARLILANRAATSVWGARWPYDQPLQAFLAENHIRLSSPTGRPLLPAELPAVRAVQQGETVRQHQEIIRHPDGSHLPVLVSAVALGTTSRLQRLPTALSSAEVERPEPMALVVHQDVTVLKEAEYLKDEFIGIAAHELRNPVAALVGYASMLQVQTARGHGPALAEWQREALQEIDQASRRLVALTEELLDVTRLQAGRLLLQKTSTDVVGVARRMVSRLQRTTKRHQLSLHSSSSRVLAMVDPGRIEQVLANLLTNAIKYSPKGGPIDMQVHRERSQHEVLISIRDWGMGIPKGQQAQIFGRFMRADNAQQAGIGGTGLGLYLCRELVELHGGRIWFESAEGAGTTFFITLPQASDSAI